MESMKTHTSSLSEDTLGLETVANLKGGVKNGHTKCQYKTRKIVGFYYMSSLFREQIGKLPTL